MSLKIRSLVLVLLMIMLFSSVVSGRDVQGMAIIANKPSALGIGPVAPGHLAFAFQDPLDGLFVFGSVGLDLTKATNVIDPTDLDINKKYTFNELKGLLAEKGYESYKAFYVTNPNVNAALNTENDLTTANYNLFASTTKPVTDTFSHAVNADDENCLTATKKVLTAYGVDLPDTDNPNPLTAISPASLPNVYYLTLPGDVYYPDFMGDDPVVPTGYKKSTSTTNPNIGQIENTINGNWEGKYSYSDGRAPVTFTAILTQNGNKFSGRTQEPNTFGDPSASFLYANVEGSVSSDSVTFIKTYDGTGNVNHSVNYYGKLDISAGKIFGTWAIGSTTGSFEMSLA